MHLKSLALHGFKSFADPTTFEFHEGVTAIVGPNGCGKSNVVDGIRWVLGETSAKALRGSEMADVIFSGTDNEKSRKELGMAEVTLTLADCEDALRVDFNEVAITRRVFRDGKSEYRINGTLCRLRDIHEMFMDTGIGRASYSIMEQGKIDLLLSARPEDRRQVFEEAAGVTKFKKEKKEALRKLEYTEANLLRVADVLAEQERRINSLKRQVAKARRYQVLAADVKILDTHFSHRQFVELSAEAEELANSLRSLERQRSGLEADLPARESAVVDARDEAQRLEAELSELRQQLSGYQNAMRAAESRIGFNQERREELEVRIARHREDIAATGEKLAQQEFDFNASQTELNALAGRIAEHENLLEQKCAEVAKLAEQRESTERRLVEAREESKQVETVLASTQAKLESAELQSSGSQDRLRVLGDESEVLKSELAEVLATDQDLTSRIAAARGKTQELEETVQSTERSFQHARGDRDAARQRRDERERELTVKQSRLDVLKQLLAQGEGLREGTKKVLAGLDDPGLIQPGLRGVLGNFLRVKPSFEPAVEAALGANLEAVLVRDAALADSILDRLAEQAAGEAALVAPEWVPAGNDRQMMTVPDGAECWAADCVETEADVAPVVDHLLEKVLVVADRATALGMRGQQGEFTLVTRQGEVLRPEGIIKGGRGSGDTAGSLLERQNEVADLETAVTGLTEKVGEASRNLATQEERTEQLHEEAEQAKDRLQRHQVELSTLEGQHSLASREAKSLQGKLESLNWERQDITTREESAVQSRATLAEEVQAARARGEELASELQRLEHHLAEYARREEAGNEERNSILTAVAVERRAREAAEQQQMPMEARLNELRELNARRQAEIDEAEQRIASASEEDERLRVEIGENRTRCEALQAELEEAGGRRSGLQRAINEAEAALSDLRHRISSLGEQRGRQEVSAAKVDMKLDKLLETIMERYQADLRTFEPDSHQLLACIAEQRK
ncbi:MAG: chromosome segregation protein SMC, partial [Akkermansiaceae bacterium]|nr:chromosome segregation protein SMC [Akkermansiaceae bacterium]